MKYGIRLSVNGAGRGNLTINGKAVDAEKITIEVDAGKQTKVTLIMPPKSVFFRSDDIGLTVPGFERVKKDSTL